MTLPPPPTTPRRLPGWSRPLHADAGRGPVEDELPIAAGPVRMERGAVRSAGSVLAADARHDS